jgi:SAM-dependent methyltransferase
VSFDFIEGGSLKAHSNQTLSNSGCVSERDRAEMARSANEARKIFHTAIDYSQVKRYLDPAADTRYPLEYAFHLLGDIRNKAVVDLGCGTGENLVPLAKRGADVTGIDISPDLIQHAQQTIVAANITARALVGSAYDSGFENESVDVIFCVALIHHLEIPKVRDEMHRILKKGGVIILSEPVRFSKVYDRIRKMLPAQEDVSEFEHPLTISELDSMCETFMREKQRLFRLPFVAISHRLFHKTSPLAYQVSDWIIRTCPVFKRFATTVVVRLRK